MGKLTFIMHIKVAIYAFVHVSSVDGMPLQCICLLGLIHYRRR